jgi:hypothetical protein
MICSWKATSSQNTFPTLKSLKTYLIWSYQLQVSLLHLPLPEEEEEEEEDHQPGLHHPEEAPGHNHPEEVLVAGKVLFRHPEEDLYEEETDAEEMDFNDQGSETVNMEHHQDEAITHLDEQEFECQLLLTTDHTETECHQIATTHTEMHNQ